MKRFRYLLIIILTVFMSISYVDAENIIFESTNNNLESEIYCTNGCANSFNDSLNHLMAYRDVNTYKYYVVYYNYAQSNKLSLIQFNSEAYTLNVSTSKISITINSTSQRVTHTYSNNSLFTSTISEHTFDFFNDGIVSLIDTNCDFILQGASYEIQNFYTDNIILESGYVLPTYLSLKKYDSWVKYPIIDTNNVEVNLDDYEYVILSLKDYSRKDAFDTNLKVKGMIGITPVYEYGTVEKTEITDRCNTSYSDYTDYRLYVLKNDLLNNAVYIVKKCEINSSFKFDSTVFNITYVTADNVNDPVITVGGQEYHTIPFNQLSNSANKNEEENFIPGESEGFHPIESLTDYVTSFWNSLSTFMGLVTKFFNTLPIEIKAVCITFFTTACTLGLLKILKH